MMTAAEQSELRSLINHCIALVSRRVLAADEVPKLHRMIYLRVVPLIAAEAAGAAGAQYVRGVLRAILALVLRWVLAEKAASEAVHWVVAAMGAKTDKDRNKIELLEDLVKWSSARNLTNSVFAYFAVMRAYQLDMLQLSVDDVPQGSSVEKISRAG